MTCEHDFRVSDIEGTTRFFGAVLTFGLSEMVAPRRCRKCGAEDT